MPARGDITADEVYADREMLNRLGYGIFDVNFGSAGPGFDNIRNFSYLVAQDEDPKLYRRKVFDLIGRYYPNPLAKAMWNRFVDHKIKLSEEKGEEVDLPTAANDWFKQHGHQFLKDWTFQQPEIPERLRNQGEPQRGLLGVVAGTFFPDLRELLTAGFTITDVTRAAITEAVHPGLWKALPLKKSPRRRLHIVPTFPHRRPNGKKKLEKNAGSNDADWQDTGQYFRIQKLAPADIVEGRYYVRLVAKLTGHEPHSPEEAERRWSEILEHKWYMSERAGHDVGIRAAALDYFRRLNLIQQAESGSEV